MKIIHTADIHIGDGREIEDYLTRHRGVLTQIIDYTRKTAQSYETVLIIAGDLFHRKKITSEERILADWWLGEINSLGVKTILIGGNHDHLYGEVTNISGYDHIKFGNIYVVPWHPKLIPVGSCAFLCLPWQGYSEAELKDLIYSMLHQESARSADRRIVVMHECVIGSKFDNGILAERGINLPYIPDIDYWAMGDIHAYQSSKLDNAWYSGSPLQFKFSERADKGFIVLDTDTNKHEFIRTTFKPMKIISSTDQIKEDAYYYLKGDIGQVIEANKSDNVIRTDWTLKKQEAIDYPKLGITDGLTGYLAERGCDQTMQTQALAWVKQVVDGIGQ